MLIIVSVEEDWIDVCVGGGYTIIKDGGVYLYKEQVFHCVKI